MPGRLRIGTSSWSDHKNWYPPGTKAGDQLSFYATQFPIVEINMTYYRIPSTEMVQSWVRKTPDGFTFDVKPPRQLTSTPEQPGGEAPEPDAAMAEQFGRSLQPLRDAGKLGAITYQFPPSYHNTEPHREYIRLLPELHPGDRLSVEFRQRNWLDERHADQTLALLRDAGLSYSMADEPQVGSGSVPPVYGVTNTDLAIIRFHGRNTATWYNTSGTTGERFNWFYTEAELVEWLDKIGEAVNSAIDVHIFFNTNYLDQGPVNAHLLMRLLGIQAPPGRLF